MGPKKQDLGYEDSMKQKGSDFGVRTGFHPSSLDLEQVL